MYAVMSRSHRVHDAIGTVQVTALGMFAGGGGFAIAPPTLASLAVVVGGISSLQVDGHVETLDQLDLTVTIDHNVVDGAPAARFAGDLRQIMQRADWHQPPGRCRERTGGRGQTVRVARVHSGCAGCPRLTLGRSSRRCTRRRVVRGHERDAEVNHPKDDGVDDPSLSASPSQSGYRRGVDEERSDG